MIKSICPHCNKESIFITWDLTNVRCGKCWNIFNYKEIIHEIVKGYELDIQSGFERNYYGIYVS